MLVFYMFFVSCIALAGFGALAPRSPCGTLLALFLPQLEPSSETLLGEKLSQQSTLIANLDSMNGFNERKC